MQVSWSTLMNKPEMCSGRMVMQNFRKIGSGLLPDVPSTADQVQDRFHQRRTAVHQLLPGGAAQFAQQGLALGGDGEDHLAAVGGGAQAPEKTALLAAVDELHHAVMVQLHSFGQPANRR